MPQVKEKETLYSIAEVVDGWKLLDTKTITLTPSEEEIAGWELLKTIEVTLTPSEEEIAGWELLKTVEVTLYPKGTEPPVCTLGKTKCVGQDLYTCGDDKQWHLTEANSAKCVTKPFPWLWVGVGGAIIAGIVLLAPKKPKEHLTKKT